MSLLLQQQNSNIKPKRSVTNLPTKTEIEFRWSILAAKIALQDETSLTTLHTIDLNSPKKKSFLSSQSSTARSFTTNQSSLLAQNLLPRSPRLSNVNNINKTKELSTDQNDDERKSPLILTYSQLHRAQQQPKQNETSQTSFSMYPLINNKQRSVSNIYSRLPFSSKSISSTKILRRLAIKYKK